VPFVTHDDVKLSVEIAGRGPPIVFAHESAADQRQWSEQVAALSDRFLCITYNARGYPPSDVPIDDPAYGYEQAWRDLACVVEQAANGPAHVVGLSMGAYAGLMLGLHRPELVRSLFLAGCGTGSTRGANVPLRDAMHALAMTFETQGIEAGARQIALPANRTGFQERDPIRWQSWYDDLATHSAEGMARTFRNYQGDRPSLYEFEDGLREMHVPTLLATGDEDEGCHEVNGFLVQTLPDARLEVFQQCGHAINLEAPARFNRMVADFVTAREADPS